jgi:hypothetical protein
VTEYELLDYVSSLMANFQSALALYFTIVTAYVVAAFIAGDRLTRLQLLIVNTCFAIAVGIVGSLTVLIFARFYSYAIQVSVPEGAPVIDFRWPLGLLVLAVFIGCLVFMWSIRNKTKRYE